MPPKSLADVASLTLTPDEVSPLLSPFSGGEQAAMARIRPAEAVTAVSARYLFIFEPSSVR